MLYPLKFNPILIEKIWGGQKLKSLYPSSEHLKNIGESWLISAIESSESIVADGFLAENNIPELQEVYLNDLVGDSVYDRYGDRFPLLVKLIDAADKLSIQVHPNDEIAKRQNGSMGKNEFWYILDCDDNAFVYAGFNREITKEEYLNAVENNTLENLLQKHTVKKGDYINIPSGCVHAIGNGCTILEVQQSSNITYRIYDYDRKDNSGNLRELHTSQALEAIDFKHWKQECRSSKTTPNEAKALEQNEYFKILLLEVDKTQEIDLSELDSFAIMTTVAGSININIPSYKVELQEWEATLIPATIRSVIVSPTTPTAQILIAYIPQNKSISQKLTL